VRALAVELAPIRVDVVSPGRVDTPIWQAVAGGPKGGGSGDQGGAPAGWAALDGGRDRALGMAREEAAPLHLAQRLRQHLLRDAGQAAVEDARARRAAKTDVKRV
jgi:NAD(P)-dependent dehydrogenase (short-subunit alcohol dehydrogenase family)